MTHYNTLHVKLSNLQLNKLKSGIKNGTKVTSNLSSNVIGNGNNDTSFCHKLLITITQVSRFHKSSTKNSSANTKISKTQFYKITHSGGFLG